MTGIRVAAERGQVWMQTADRAASRYIVVTAVEDGIVQYEHGVMWGPNKAPDELGIHPGLTGYLPLDEHGAVKGYQFVEGGFGPSLDKPRMGCAPEPKPVSAAA